MIRYVPTFFPRQLHDDLKSYRHKTLRSSGVGANATRRCVSGAILVRLRRNTHQNHENHDVNARARHPW
jgi:hypothetical protein